MNLLETPHDMFTAQHFIVFVYNWQAAFGESPNADLAIYAIITLM